MSVESVLARFVMGYNHGVLYYFAALNTFYFILFMVSLYEVLRFVKRTFFSDYDQILRSEMTWPISIIVPAHNEAQNIVETVRSLLNVNYGQFEVIIVNDGSQDETLQEIVRTFDLKRTDRIYHRTLQTRPVRGIEHAFKTRPGVMKLSVPRSSSSPQRPQFE